ncbi:MAG: hydantoinase/carbamoylase family amidase [Alphaproteobacteria bacterium]|nr:hydantoinase/carbamoylase family amidase [Alphaproteobacteria bacterium]
MRDFAAPDMMLAERLFGALDTQTRQGRGIVRDTYGRGEEAAHTLIRETGRSLGLDVDADAAGNTYVTLPGADSAAPCVMIGSHLDSVLQGGNYDGAAGVVAGIAVLAGMRQAGVVPSTDVKVMGIRAEEGQWFDTSYVGTFAAFGQLEPAVLDVRRIDTKRTMAEHMIELGIDPGPVRRGAAYLQPDRIRQFLELHIEQGPVLIGAGIPVGLVTGIRGCMRFRNAQCVGEYGHSGALPRLHRHDAVAATVDLIHALQQDWLRVEKEGQDLVFTTGEFYTDAAMHGPSKVSGETRFVLDFRSIADSTMEAMRLRALELAERVGRKFAVRFDLHEPLYSAPALLDPTMRASLGDIASEEGIAAMELASGAGHDASVFANLGIPTAMLFVRNANGSHNPDEAMDMADFAAATRILAAHVQRVTA